MGEWDAPVKPVNTKKRRWPRILGIVGGSLVALLIVTYFVITSAWFLKTVVLPRAGAALHCALTIEDASIQPFSAITITGLQVRTSGEEALLRADEVHARYSLWAILGGHLEVAEATVKSPIIQLVENADGTSNLDPILKAFSSEPSPKPAAPASTEPARLDLQNITLQNATVRHLKNLPGGGRQVTEIKRLNFAADKLANGCASTLKLDTDLRFDQGLATPSNAVVSATLNGQFNLSLDAGLKPESIQGKLQVGVTEALGPGKEAAEIVVALEADVTPKEIRALAVRFSKGATPLGLLSVNGPFDTAKLEGQLNIDLSGIDRQVLNLVGPALGGDFATTTLNSSNVVVLAEGAKTITLQGQVAVNQFALLLQGQSTPKLDFGAVYHVTVDQAAKRADLQALTIHATQNQAPLLRGVLAKPMRIDWSGAGEAVEESSFDLVVTNFNLADWRAFAPGVEPAGRFEGHIGVVARQSTRKLQFDLRTELADFAARLGSNRIANTDLTLTLRAELDDFKKLTLTTLQTRLAHAKQVVAELNVSGTADLNALEAELATSATVSLSHLTELVGLPELKLTDGTLRLEARVAQKLPAAGQAAQAVFDRTLAGNAHLEALTGRYAACNFDRFGLDAEWDLSLRNQVAEIKKLGTRFQQRGQAGGSIEVS